MIIGLKCAYVPDVPKKGPLFDLMKVENDYMYAIFFYVFLILILQVKSWYKAVQDRLKGSPSNDYRKLKFRDSLMTDDPIFFPDNALI